MKATSNDKLIAYLALFSGLAISAVAIYYSVMGLVAIYPAMIIPIVIMGVVIEIGKLSATVWLKQSWAWAPVFLKAYILPAIAMLMFITSIGVFGFLSKAHSDQSLVSGDVQSKIAIYDEKIKISKDNIDANRKALKQMDEAVDQVMGRSSDEKGAEKAVGIRRSQQKERQRLQSEIASEQKTITALSEERAPIAAEVRKVEAEVGPIKYIAALMYGDNPDANVLERAVTWVTILIVIVLDPLAVVLLLASQYSFQRIRKLEEPDYEADDGPLTDDQVTQLNAIVEEDQQEKELDDFLWRGRMVAKGLDADEERRIVQEANNAIAEMDPEPIEYQILEDADDEPEIDSHAYLKTDKSFWAKPEGWVSVPPQVYIPEKEPEVPVPVEQWNAMIAQAEAEAKAEADSKYQIMPELVKKEIIETPDPRPEYDFTALPADTEYVNIDGSRMHIRAAKDLYQQSTATSDGYVQNEEQKESGVWNRVISEAEYRDRVVTVTNPNDPTNNPNNPA